MYCPVQGTIFLEFSRPATLVNTLISTAGLAVLWFL